MGKPEHLDIAFTDEPADLLPLPDDWVVDPAGDGTFAVSGACPRCHGVAYGPELPLMPERAVNGGDGPLGGRDREVVARCDCGHDHGEGRAKGCGGSWVVRFDSAGRP